MIGGPSASDAILHVVADVLGRPVLAGPAAMAGAIGAAGIAMESALGLDLRPLAHVAAGMKLTEPNHERAARYADCFREYVHGNP